MPYKFIKKGDFEETYNSAILRSVDLTVFNSLGSSPRGGAYRRLSEMIAFFYAIKVSGLLSVKGKYYYVKAVTVWQRLKNFLFLQLFTKMAS